MFSLLQQPYPVYFSKKQSILTSLLVGLFVGAFLCFFQPFGLHYWEHPHKLWLLSGYGLITGLLMLTWEILHMYLSRRQEEKWTVGKEMISIFLLVTAIGTANWLYSTWIGFAKSTPSHFLNYVGMTYLVGIFPTALIPLFNYILKLRKHSRISQQLTHQLQHQPHILPPNENIVVLIAENEKDSFSCPIHLLYSIASADNYATIHFRSPDMDDLEKHLIRSSLTRLEEQLKDSDVMRCHRSYLVNMALVESVSGNAQGYQLHLYNHPSIPLSRKYAPKILQWLRNRNNIQPQ